MRVCGACIAVLALGWRIANAQEPTATLPAIEIAPATTPESPEDLAAEEWTISLSAYTYVVPDDRDYVQPTLSIDYDWLHLEARYNYEDLRTASAWIGINFSIGEDFTFDFTPMIGGVFGNTRGIAPGYEITLAWRGIELYTEGEFVFDADDSSDNFFYCWTELTYAPNDWLRGGVVMQRTRVRDEDRDIEIGPMLGLTWRNFDFSAFVLFANEGDPTVGLGLSLEF